MRSERMMIIEQIDILSSISVDHTAFPTVTVASTTTICKTSLLITTCD